RVSVLLRRPCCGRRAVWVTLDFTGLIMMRSRAASSNCTLASARKKHERQEPCDPASECEQPVTCGLGLVTKAVGREEVSSTPTTITTKSHSAITDARHPMTLHEAFVPNGNNGRDEAESNENPWNSEV